MRHTLLTNFQVYNPLLLTIGTMLYSRSLKLIHLAQLRLYSLNNNSQFPLPTHPPQPLAPISLLSVAMTLAILDSSYK